MTNRFSFEEEIMQTQSRKKTWVLRLALLFALGIHTYLVVVNFPARWLIFPIGITYGCIIGPLVKSFPANEIFWNYVNHRDKFLFGIGYFIFLLLSSIAIDLFSLPMVILISSIGISIQVLIIHFWGSDAIKEKYLWKKSKQTP